MPVFNITEFDLFFLSYDEPNAEKHYGDLLDKAPWAQRIHGIKGFDSAHRACANESSTDWFITVDADNIVNPNFFDITVDFDPITTPKRTFSWNGRNVVNGLVYGNGGLKLWSKKFVLNMNSHENADDKRKEVDFCWENDYEQKPEIYSDVVVNGSPYQAFRVGFREGVKLTLDRGERVKPDRMRDTLHSMNLRNIKIWCSVGSDIENGLWTILGARMGWSAMCDLEWNHTVIRDYDWMKVFFENHPSLDKWLNNRSALIESCVEFGEKVERATKIKLPLLTDDVSEFFRSNI